VTTSMELARRSGGRRGPFSTGVCRRRGGRGLRRLPSVASLERGTGGDREEGWSQAATGEGLSVAQLSRPRGVLDDSYIIIEVCLSSQCYACRSRSDGCRRRP
jgi:hypothetical protein